jgi:hypothetical protein
MPALVAGIHVLNARSLQKTWMAGNKSGHDGDDACGRCLLADGRALLLQVPRWPAFGAAITAASRRSNPNAYDRAKRCVLGPKIGRFRNQELSPLRSPCRRHHLPLGSRSSGDSWYGGAGSCFGAHSPNNPLAGTNSAASAKNYCCSMVYGKSNRPSPNQSPLRRLVTPGNLRPAACVIAACRHGLTVATASEPRTESNVSREPSDPTAAASTVAIRSGMSTSSISRSRTSITRAPKPRARRPTVSANFSTRPC